MCGEIGAREKWRAPWAIPGAPSLPTYLSDFRWRGRLNFDTDVERTDQGDSHREAERTREERKRELDRRLPFKTNIRQ